MWGSNCQERWARRGLKLIGVVWAILLGLLLLCGKDALFGAFPDIRVNNQTGANPPAASGAPANFGPVIPPAGCATAGASTTIQSVGHGLGLVPVDGTAAVWIETAAGRRWSRITSVPNADTFVVDNSFNIAAAVACAVGGVLDGTLANITGLCDDLKFGWTVTIEETGTDYTDSGACAIANTASSGAATDGSIIVRGDDPTTRSVILWQSNANYLNTTESSGGWKVENLEIVKDAAGTLGFPVELKANGVLKNVLIRSQTGTWNVGVDRSGSNSPLILNNEIRGAFTAGTCTSAASDLDVIMGNYFDGCRIADVAGIFAFNILNAGGASVTGIGVGTVGSLVFHNTVLEAGQAGIDLNSFARTIVVGSNLVVESASLGSACLAASFAAASNLLGENGNVPNILWRGNNAFDCPNGRYDATLAATPQGEASDLVPGAGVDPDFRDALNLDFFPLNAALVDPAAFPGSTYPFLTPALPESIPTAGAPQRSAGGAGAYAY